MTDKKDKRKGWLAKLEVGSVVLFDRGHAAEFPAIAKVQKITPTGRLEVLGTKFSQNGREIGSCGWSRAILCEPTDEMIRRIVAWKVLKNLDDKVSKVMRCETYAKKAEKADLIDIRKLETAIDHLGDIIFEINKNKKESK